MRGNSLMAGLALSMCVSGCEEQLESSSASSGPLMDHGVQARGEVTLPVVYHVVPLSKDGKVYSIAPKSIQQNVDLLERNFKNQNPILLGNFPKDLMAQYKTSAPDSQIRFKLALQNPSGGESPGIRYYPPVDENFFQTEDQLKKFADDYKWPTNEYINIFVLPWLADNIGSYGSFEPNLDVVFLRIDTFLLEPSLNALNLAKVVTQSTKDISGYNYSDFAGAITTHEIGHYLSLSHLIGNSGEDGKTNPQCLDDGIDDTPLQKNIYFDKDLQLDQNSQVVFPIFDNCTIQSKEDPAGVMFMNNMNENAYASVFTEGQMDAMTLDLEVNHASLKLSPALTPGGCVGDPYEPNETLADAWELPKFSNDKYHRVVATLCGNSDLDVFYVPLTLDSKNLQVFIHKGFQFVDPKEYDLQLLVQPTDANKEKNAYSVASKMLNSGHRLVVENNLDPELWTYYLAVTSQKGGLAYTPHPYELWIQTSAEAFDF